MNEQANIKSAVKRPVKWRTLIGIALVICAIVLDMPILFGLLYIIWAIQEMVYGQAYILENINKHENKVLFWIIVLLWLGCGIYVFADSLIGNWIKPVREYNSYNNEYRMPDEEYENYTEIENGYLYTDENGDITFFPFADNR